jgi:hypothetical protein
MALPLSRRVVGETELFCKYDSAVPRRCRRRDCRSRADARTDAHTLVFPFSLMRFIALAVLAVLAVFIVLLL